MADTLIIFINHFFFNRLHIKFQYLNMANNTHRRNFLKKAASSGIILSLGGFTAAAKALAAINTAGENSNYKIDHLLRSVPKNMVYGYYGADVPPVLKVKNGEVVEIQTINTTGINKKDPEAFFIKNNMPLDEHAKDVIDILNNVQPDPKLFGHMLTGPIYIEGAEVGDTLEVRILDIKLRSNYGVNSVWPKGGALPEAVTTPESFVYRYNTKNNTASFKEGIEIPIRPFMGVMAVSPPAEMGRVSSIPPAFYGGNLDLKHLVKGTTLFLPVSVKGALFTTGDCHAAEGNGEVSGVAIEASLSLVAEFIVRKDKTIKQVYAETPTHIIAIGLDADLTKAMKNATGNAIKYIKEELGFTFNEALSITSTGVDLEVTQVVDQVVGVHAMIPKSIFTNKKFNYWI